MLVIKARNVHQALPKGVYELRGRGKTETSRNGEVLRMPFPVTTVYEHPNERVIFWPERDANPFFHFFEALWMLAGRNDVAFVAQFASNMKNYSDDGKTLHGAYGNRWRHHPTGDGDSIDQIQLLLKHLKENPNSRRAVLQMWDAYDDLDEDSKDIPCNTQAYFAVRSGLLDMTVTCRSNDLVWGAYGANAVHFSFLQEYMAARLGLGLGLYWQVSNDFHAYPTTLKPVEHLHAQFGAHCPYALKEVRSVPIMDAGCEREWDMDLALFMEAPDSNGFSNSFFSRVAKPLWWAHKAWKQKETLRALEILDQCSASDWKRAAVEWINRRVAQEAEKYRAQG